MRRLIVLISLLAVASFIFVAPAGSVPSDTTAGGANHVVMAIATADSPVALHSGLQVAPAGGPTVDSTNLAEAISQDCFGCKSVAVAFQAVFVIGDPNVVTPTNAAIALNLNCVSCSTYAFAHQYVLSTGGPVRLSDSGRAQINQIRQELAGLASSNLPFDQLTTELKQEKAKFDAVINDELISVGQQPNGAEQTESNVAPAD